MIPAWLLRPLTVRVATVALILAGLGGAKCWYDAGVRRTALAESRLEDARRQLDSLATEITRQADTADSLAGLFRVQRDTVRQTVIRWRTLTDTLTLSDTVPVPGPVVRVLVAAGDTAIRACQIAVSTCATRSALQDSIIAHQRKQLSLRDVEVAALRDVAPTRLETWRSRALWGALGFGLGWVAR